MKRNQKEIFLPNEGGSGNVKEVKKVNKGKFIYFAIIVLAVAGAIIIFSL